MNLIKITPTERIIVSRNGMQNSCQYQVLKEVDGKQVWTTELRRSYDGNWKGSIMEDMSAQYNAQLSRDKVYKESKLENYH